MASLSKGLLEYDMDDIVNRIGNPEVLRVPLDPSATTYTFILHTEAKDYEITLPEQYDVMKDYNGNISDYITVSFLFPMGDFIYEIYPYRNNLEFTIIKNAGNKITTLRGKFVLLNSNTNVESSVYTKMAQEEANRLSKARIKGQVIDLYTEALRTIIVTGVYNHATVKNVMLAAFQEALLGFKIHNIKQPLSLDIIEPNNTKEYRHIKLVPNINIFDLPSYLQNTDYGVYNGNIGTYFSRYNKIPTVFIYPLYDNTLFNKRNKKLILYGSYNTKYDTINSTFVKDGDIVKIVASNITFQNTGDLKLMDKGNNITRSNAKLMTEPNYNTVSDDKYINNSQPYVVQKQYKKPEDGTVKSVYIDGTDNEYKAKASMIKGALSNAQVTWRFCEDDMIYPGMPVMFLYEKDDKTIIKYTGQVQGVFYGYDFGTKVQQAVINIVIKEVDNKE